MTGLDMMLKSMGIDPDAIKQSLLNARDEVMGQVAQLNAKLDRIESKLNGILYPVKDNEQPAKEGGCLDAYDPLNTLNDQLRASLDKVELCQKP